MSDNVDLADALPFLSPLGRADFDRAVAQALAVRRKQAIAEALLIFTSGELDLKGDGDPVG